MRSRRTRIGVAIVAIVLLAGAVAYEAWPKAAPAPVTPAAATSTPQQRVIGSSVQGRPINAYFYGSGPRHVLFVGGMHGGYEWNAVIVAYDLMQYLDAHPEAVPASLTIGIVPELNVDGVYKIVGKTGPFTAADVPANVDQTLGRLNAHGVDLNRNFDCHWQPKATWRSQPVSAGTAAFSEPESAALRDLVRSFAPAAVIFWHSQSGSVYAAQCGDTMAPGELELMHAYADASGYNAVRSFDAYPVTGDSEGWLASKGIPALTVELTTHTDVEWDKNLAGIEAVIAHEASKH